MSAGSVIYPAPLGSGGGDACYDLDSFLFRQPSDVPPPASDGVAYTATLFHELSHWIQHHGTSIGCLLSLIRYSQHKTILGQRRNVPAVQWSAALRRREQGIPFIPVGEGSLTVDKLGDTAEFINSVRQIWFDHSLAYATILDSTLTVPAVRPLNLVFGDIMSDALGQCSDCQFATYPGNAVARPWFRFSADELRFVRNRQGDRVTTRSLLEAATTAGELLTYLHLDSVVRTSTTADLVARTTRMLWRHGSTYGAAAKMFCEILNIAEDSFVRAIPTLAVVTDIALNPPVPPIQVTVSGRVSWDQFYPPVRFVRAASAVSKVGLLEQSTSDAALRKYWQTLADASGLLTASEGAHPVTNRRFKCDFDAAADGHSLERINCDYFEHVLWIQSKFRDLRRRSFGLVVHPASYWSRPTETDILDFLLGVQGKHWFKPQLTWNADGGIGGPGDSKEFRGWLLLSTAFHYFLPDVLTSVDRPELDAYPPEVRNTSEVWRQLNAAYERALGVSAVFD